MLRDTFGTEVYKFGDALGTNWRHIGDAAFVDWKLFSLVLSIFDHKTSFVSTKFMNAPLVNNPKTLN